MTFEPVRFTERRIFAERPSPSPTAAPRRTVLSLLEISPSFHKASGSSNHSPPIDSGRTITRSGVDAASFGSAVARFSSRSESTSPSPNGSFVSNHLYYVILLTDGSLAKTRRTGLDSRRPHH